MRPLSLSRPRTAKAALCRIRIFDFHLTRQRRYILCLFQIPGNHTPNILPTLKIRNPVSFLNSVWNFLTAIRMLAGNSFPLILTRLANTLHSSILPVVAPPSIRLKSCALLSFSFFFSIRHRLSSALLSGRRLSQKAGFLLHLLAVVLQMNFLH